jgi:hypothetical protein
MDSRGLLRGLIGQDMTQISLLHLVPK